MDAKKFVLSYYKNATDDFHITRIAAPKEALHPHSHAYFQIYCVLSGKLLHHIEGSTAELTEGDVFILPPNLPHHITVPDGQIDFYSLSFMPDYFRSLHENKLVLDFLSFLNTEPTGQIHPKITLSYEDAQFAQMLLQRILEEFSGSKTGGQVLIRECVCVLLSLFARVYFEEQADTLHAEENRQLVLHCVEYMKNHFDEELSLTEMVRRSAMSRTCFCTLFRELVGTSFKDYLNRCRIEKAAELIAGGEKISNAGLRCGYSDFSTFYRNFKKYKGIPPSASAANRRG